jgi:hypothetical protein
VQFVDDFIDFFSILAPTTISNLFVEASVWQQGGWESLKSKRIPYEYDY